MDWDSLILTRIKGDKEQAAAMCRGLFLPVGGYFMLLSEAD
jgi:hypothetical protein